MSLTKELSTKRQTINELDCHILRLLTTRAKIANDIGHIKAEHDEKIYCLEREKAVIEDILSINNSLISHSDLSAIYEAIVAGCRNVQLQNKPTEQTTMAIQGIKGCHSEAAMTVFCQKHRFKHCQYEYKVSSQNVVNAVIDGECDYGIIAMNNELAGMVAESIEAIQNKPCYLVEWLSIPIRHFLLRKPSALNTAIKTIASHPQALKQCHDTIQSLYPGCKTKAVADTAEAAMQLANNELGDDVGVLAPSICADYYHLAVAKRDMQDCKKNRTWFAIIRRRQDGE